MLLASIWFQSRLGWMERLYAREQLRPEDFGELDGSAFQHNFLFFRATLLHTKQIQTTTNWERNSSVLRFALLFLISFLKASLQLVVVVVGGMFCS